MQLIIYMVGMVSVKIVVGPSCPEHTTTSNCFGPPCSTSDRCRTLLVCPRTLRSGFHRASNWLRTVVPCSEGELAIQLVLLPKPSQQTLLSFSLALSVGEGGLGLFFSASQLGNLVGV